MYIYIYIYIHIYTNIRNTDEAVLWSQYFPRPSYHRGRLNVYLDDHTDQSPKGRSQYNGQGEYWDSSTASEVFLIFTTKIYSYYAVVM